MAQKPTLAIAIIAVSVFSLFLISTTPSQAKGKLTKCELAEAEKIYKHPNFPGLCDDAVKAAKKRCAYRAKQNKKKNTAVSFGANTKKRGFALK